MRRNAWNILLFVLTVFSTYLIGGGWYSLALISILLGHEMGHFIMSRRHGVPATLTGLLCTLPVIVIGLLLSEPIPLSQTQDNFIRLGDSLLFSFVQKVVVGGMPDGQDLCLHPIAYAGWVGLFVTALNLLPVGQLDGGHIAYALLGKKSKFIFSLTIMLWMGISFFFYVGWTLMIVLVLLFGFRHPPPLDDLTPLDSKRKILGGIVFTLFVLSFTPVPFLQAPGGIRDILQ